MDITLLLRQIEQAGACIALLNKPTAETLQEAIQENLPEGMEIEDLKVSYADILDNKLTLTTTLVIQLPDLSQAEKKAAPQRRAHRATTKPAPAAPAPTAPEAPVTPPAPPAPPQ